MTEIIKTKKVYDNFFSTTLTQSLPSTGVGDYEVYISDEPSDDEVYFVVEPDATNKREIIRCWKPDAGFTGYLLTNDDNRGLSGGQSASEHLINSIVELRNSAQIFAQNDEFLEKIKFGKVEIVAPGSLEVKIHPFFGSIAGQDIRFTGTTHFKGVDPIDGTTFAGAETVLMVDDSTNYVEIDKDGIIFVNQVGWSSKTLIRKRLAIVTTVSGSITNIVDSREFGNIDTGSVVEESVNYGFELEVPAGTIDGANTTFTVVQAPATAKALTLYLDGLKVPYGAGPGKYTVTGSTIAMGTAPEVGQLLEAQILF